MLSNKDLNDLYQLFLVIEQNNSIGINIIDTLEAYKKDENVRSHVKTILDGVLKSLHSGDRVSGAFGKYPEFFPSYIVEMMRVNESTGQSYDIYSQITEHLEKEQDLRRNIGSEMYIILLMVFSMLVAFSISFFKLIPAIAGMSKDLNTELPVITKVFMQIGTFMLDYWWMEAIGLILVIAGVIYIRLYHPIAFAKALLNIPLYHDILYNDLQYRFAKIFSVCVAAGLNTVSALELAASASDNILVSETVKSAIKYINRSGMDLVSALKKANIYNVIDHSYYQMIEAGSRGNMSQVINRRAIFFQKELISKSKNFSTKVSTMIIVPGFIGLITILGVAAFPIINIMSNITKGGFGM